MKASGNKSKCLRKRFLSFFNAFFKAGPLLFKGLFKGGPILLFKAFFREVISFFKALVNGSAAFVEGCFLVSESQHSWNQLGFKALR